jgi:8-oxo-dGTP pyrophosphatase MutT (NUDIX family)
MATPCVVCHIRREGRVLLQLKREGRVGGGLWNGPGGKIDDGESPETAVRREVLEETGLELDEVEHHGTLTFYFGAAPEPVYIVDVFTSDSFAGELCAGDEGTLEWHAEDAIPYERMWADDAVWLPHVLAGSRVSGWFRLSEDMRCVVEHDLRIEDAEG